MGSPSLGRWNENCEVLLHLLGGAPGQNPVELEYTMPYSARVNLLDEEDRAKVLNNLLMVLDHPPQDAKGDTDRSDPLNLSGA